MWASRPVQIVAILRVTLNVTYIESNISTLKRVFKFFLKNQKYHTSGYWSHQCSWTLTTANSRQVHNIKSLDFIPK